MDTVTVAFLSPFILMGLVVFISGLALITKIWGRFVTGTVQPGEIGQFFEGIGMFFGLVVEFGLAAGWLFILGVPTLIIGLGISVAIIDGIFGTDLTGMLSR